ncbi:hypothetical protein CANINC_002854 [Pichia inconspicua]|uniref:DNA repair protein RAD50 n=1 Tax=Pichia inconspicua TaxID=52247 RepID=A0A4T0X1U1_9ASCO|nr:hypothetical protein CANINC_002854 [[Candida] inconspicua]
MATIYKLSISGIRSFSDESQETIQFGKPLTLIVGTNGSGKTTIIECLRYATTNELPPNTKNGASFINDPNLHSSNDTKAQIKLAFQNTRRVNLILSKSLMATRNPRTNTISFKTKENQLMSINNNERQTISSKVADIENLIPQHLGVSKAILNYVVFCHQDESLWPISESALLKKKFDDIFDSTKFIRILDNLKSITKEINADIKLINNNVQHLKNDKLRAAHKRDSIRTLQQQILANTDSMSTFKERITNVAAELATLYTSNQNYERTISQLESLQKDKDNVIKNIGTIKLTLEPINKPKEALLDDLNNFAQVIANQTNDCSNMQTQISDKLQKLDELRKSLNSLHMHMGNYEARHAQHDANLRRKEEMIFAVKDTIPGVTENFDNSLRDKIESLKSLFADRNSRYEALLDEINTHIMDAKLAHSKEKNLTEYLASDISALRAKLTELKSRHASIAGTETRITALRAEHERKNEALRKVKELNEVATLNALIEEETRKIALLELDLEENQRRLHIARANNDVVAKIAFLKEMNESSTTEMQAAEAKIARVLEPGMDYGSALAEVDTACNKKRADLESRRLQRSKAQASLENELRTEKTARSEEKKLINHFKALQIQCRNMYGGALELELDKYADAVAAVERDCNEDMQDLKDLQFLLAFNERAIQTAEKKHTCLLCRRGFADTNGEHDTGGESLFVEMLKRRNTELASRIGIEDKVNRKEALMGKLRDFRGEAARLVELQTETIPNIEAAIASRKQEVADIDAEVSVMQTELEALTERVAALRSVEQDVSLVAGHRANITDRSAQITRLSDQLAEEGVIDGASCEDLERAEKKLYEEVKSVRSSLESVKRDRDMKVKRNSELEKEVTAVLLAINELEMKSLDKVNIEKAVREVEEQLQSNSENYEACLKRVAECEKTLVERETEHKRQVAVRDSDLGEVRSEITKFEEIAQRFAKINEEIAIYERDEVEKKYTKCKEEISCCEREVSMMEGKIGELRKELKRLETLVSQSSNQERNIRSNLNLIQLEEDLISLNEQIEQLDASQAYVERTNFLKRTGELQEVQNKYQKQLATKVGETSQLERQVHEIESELKRDYHDIDSKYTAEYARLQTKLAMATDLATLYKVTDNGVMEYHQSQMSKINNIIDELWKKTYTGNDVETIKIKADPVAARKTSTTTASNNRSYNYRVVMVKNGTELDMRGRCSAGQRVLASIIIRIALAECFCLNFGMIALDEPTTNLDDENVESLARALHAIIRERSAQQTND